MDDASTETMAPRAVNHPEVQLAHQMLRQKFKAGLRRAGPSRKDVLTYAFSTWNDFLDGCGLEWADEQDDAFIVLLELVDAAEPFKQHSITVTEAIELYDCESLRWWRRTLRDPLLPLVTVLARHFL